MREGWEIKKLGEAFQIKPPKSEARETLQPSDAVSFVPMEDLGVLTKAINVVKERKLEDVAGSYTYFGENDVLLAKITPCFENGKLGIAKNLLNEVGFGSSEFIVFRSKNVVTSEYLFYFLSRDEFREEGKKRMTGAVGHKRVSKDWIENYPLPFPRSKSEQQRIVSILDEAFAAIDKAKANVQKNLSNAKELFQSELNAIFSQKGEKWVEKSLSEVCETKPPKKEAREILRDDDLVTFLPMEDLSVEARHIKPQRQRILKEVAGSYTYFADGDVLLAKITPCFENGKIGIACNLKNGIGFGSSEYMVFRTKGEVDRELLYYFLSRKSFREEGAPRMTGAVGHKRVAKDWIENYPIEFPASLAEQQRIVSKLNDLEIKSNKLGILYERKLSELDALKKSILQKAFTGELTKPILLNEAAA